ncbi:MAG: DUF2797 domain-containing protein [Gammaproteobacteria bacterium]|nr:DUF2797 domain-containing protein [Gammaproteobacteria bacterium]
MTANTPLSGNLRKMQTSLENIAQYTLMLDGTPVDMNAKIGETIKLSFDGTINCIACDRLTNKSFAQGFCYPCFRNAPEASECIIRPELCLAHEGEARDMAWAEKNCLVEQIVYLARSSAIKVGITRATQMPTRWIDQGATDAIVFARVPNRYTAGLVEVAMKAHLTDRTNWQRMLKNEVIDADIVATKASLTSSIDADLQQYVDTDDTVCSIEYPVDRYPEKVKSVGFDKQPEIEGRLAGIKGQYLIFDDNRVLNIRKHNGYRVTMS